MHEARIEDTPHGRLPAGDGWFILNVAEMPWGTVQGFGAWRDFDWAERSRGEPGIGVHLHILRPGENFGYYHAEEAQEGFVVLSGECLAVVEGQERTMRQWDYLHSPPNTAHVLIGAGDRPCALLMFGSPDPRRKVEWIADETAAKHGASVERTTGRDTEAYGELPAEVLIGAPPPFRAPESTAAHDERAARPTAPARRLARSEPLAKALIDAIHGGEIDALKRLLSDDPGLAAARLVDEKGGSGTPLHAVCDWPGFFPRGPEVVAVLIDAGADPSAPVEGSWHAETPLHWAASSDDVEVAKALIDGGADIEASGASIAGGSPLDDAVGYGCWHVARLLVERGARVDRLWHAAALGMTARVDELLAAEPPTQQQLTDAFWQACHGGQRRMAEKLLALGAELNGTPSWGDATPLDVADGISTGREALVNWLRDQGATKSSKVA